MSSSADRPFPWAPVVGGLLALAAVVALGVWSWPWVGVLFTDPRAARDWLASFGVAAPLVLVGLQALQVVVFAIPGEVTGIAAGWMFGFTFGSALSLVGVVIGSAVAFALARVLGTKFVHRIAGAEAVAKFDAFMASPRFVAMLFLLFLIPGVPKDILCYVAGLSRVKFWPFLILSSVARLPGLLGASLMGKALFHGEWFLLAGVALGALALFGLGWWFREPLLHFIARLTLPAEKEAPHEPR